MVASLLVAAADVTYAKLVEPLIDKILIGGAISLINWVPVFVIGLAIIKGGARYVQEYLIRTAGQLVIQKVRNELFAKAMDLSMGYHSRNTIGNLMSRTLNDVNQMQKAASTALVDAIRESLTLIGLIGLAFYQDWRLALVAFTVLPLAFGPAASIGRQIKKNTKRRQGAMGILTKALEQSLSGIKLIKAFGTEAEEVRRFEETNNIYYRFFRKLIRYNALSSPVVELLASFGIAAVLWYGMHRVLSGGMSQGELTSTLVAIVMLYTPAKRLIKVNNTVQEALGASERVFEILDTRSDIADLTTARPVGRLAGNVRFDHVDFSYADEPVLLDFNLDIAPGEIVALVGPSGAGKSTVAGLLSRFYDPGLGAVRIDGIDIREMMLDGLRNNLSLVDQETFLFSTSIAENIAYGQPNYDEEAVREAAKLAFADEFVSELPEGYLTHIGDRGVRLSGGQRQRICIARALLRDAPILILDEATSALDSESEAMVQKALVNLMRNRTTLVIAHRLSTIMHADRIVVMEGGRIVDIGTHEDLMAKEGLYRRLYQMQSGIEG
ncbi:MAG: ABC transporter permease [Desulfuromonas sp.]|nr:MAG: ABC transporter permease [Desulfuromonas sp.]